MPESPIPFNNLRPFCLYAPTDTFILGACVIAMCGDCQPSVNQCSNEISKHLVVITLFSSHYTTLPA